MLTVYGATGYTGRLVAELLSSRGVPLRIAGRNSEKLHALRDAIRARGRPAPDLAVAGIDDRLALEHLAKRSRVVLHCAGPFADYGPPMIEACLRGGAHYLDITGEARFMAATALRDGEAKRAKIALVNAVGFDVVPSDLCVHLAARALGEGGAPEEIDVALALGGGQASPGTLRSFAQVISQPSLRFEAGRDERPGSSLFMPAAVRGAPKAGHDRLAAAGGPASPGRDPKTGRYHEEPIASLRRRFDFPELEPTTAITDAGGPASPDRARGTTSFMAFNAPIGDVATAARTSGASKVRGYVKVPSPIARALRIALPAAGALSRSPIGSIVSRLGVASWIPAEGPSEEARMRARFAIVAEARRGSALARATLTGRDAYGLTAECAAAIGTAMLDAGYDRAGALTPMQALDPLVWRALLEKLGCAITT